MKCPNCNKTVKSKWNVCPYCNTAIIPGARQTVPKSNNIVKVIMITIFAVVCVAGTVLIWEHFFKEGVYVTLTPQYESQNHDDVENEELLKKSIEILKYRMDNMEIAEYKMSYSKNEIKINLPLSADTLLLDRLLSRTGEIILEAFVSVSAAELLMNKLDTLYKITDHKSIRDYLKLDNDPSYWGGSEAQRAVYSVSTNHKYEIAEWLEKPEIKDVVPVDMELAWEPFNRTINGRNLYLLYVVEKRQLYKRSFINRIIFESEGSDNRIKYMKWTLPEVGKKMFGKYIKSGQMGFSYALLFDDEILPVGNLSMTPFGEANFEFVGRSFDERYKQVVLESGDLPVKFNIDYEVRGDMNVDNSSVDVDKRFKSKKVESFDRSDPKIVGEAFLDAIKNDNFDAAETYIIENDRETIINWMQQENRFVEKIKSLETFDVYIEKNPNEANEAVLHLRGMKGRIDMINVNGDWWICK